MAQKHLRRRPAPFIVIAVLLSAALACGGSTPEPAAPAAAPPPTEPEQSGAVQTAAAQATHVALDIAATQAAQTQADDAAIAATEQALVPVLAELPGYGIDPVTEGRAGWIHPPVVLETFGPNQYDYANRYLATIATDFVIAADITWNTTTGLAGCGFLFRSDGNEEALNGYLMVATRGGNGQVAFMTLIDGELGDPESWNALGNIDWQNDATNHIALVVRGGQFMVYANGVQVRTFTPPDNAQYERGFVAMVALSESGTTRCQFDNSWLWLLN